MLMKSLFDKAAEYGSKAKNLAGGYLQGEKGKRSPEVEEMEKTYIENFTNLKKEIDSFQNDTMKNYEDKIHHLNDLINKLNKENEMSNAENKRYNEDNKKLRDNYKEIEEGKNIKIKELEDKLNNFEEKFVNSEKVRNELSAQLAYVKENQIKENFLQNMNELNNHIDSLSKMLSDENQTEKFLKLSEEDLQNFKNKLDEYLNKEGKEKEEFSSFKNDLITKYIEKYENLTNENFTLITISLNEFKNKAESNYKLLNEKLAEYSSNSEKINTDNNNLKEEVSLLKEENLNKNKKIEEIVKRFRLESEEAYKYRCDLNSEIDSLKEKIESVKREKETFANALKETQEFIKELDKSIEDSKVFSENLKENHKLEKQEILSKQKNLETELKEKSDQSQKTQQTFKQFFLLLLEEDVFIDSIEKIFKNTDKDTFFEEIYKLSKLIKPKIIYKFYNLFLSNETLIKKLEKYNLEVDLDLIQEKYKKPLTLELLNSLGDFEDEEQEDFITDTISELCGYIDNLNMTIVKQQKNINELSNQLKSVKETLEESKRNDNDKYELLNKHIVKLQQDCREYQKTEKLLKENIEHLENLLRDSKIENEKLYNKIRSLNNSTDELTKEKNSLQEKVSSITQQCDLFKVENLELSEQHQKNLSDNQILRQRIDTLLKDKDDLSSKVLEIEKLKISLNEKTDLIKQKEQEIMMLNNTHSDLEEFIENLKNEKERNTEVFKRQILEMASEIENLKETNRLHEERVQNEPILEKNIEDLDKMITNLELENKHLKEQKDKMKKYSEEILMKVKNDLKETEFLVDKRMISNLLLKYFHVGTNEKLKYALLDTLANFMAFNNEERRQIGLSVNNNSQVKSTPNAREDKLKDLSEELFNFILNS